MDGYRMRPPFAIASPVSGSLMRNSRPGPDTGAAGPRYPSTRGSSEGGASWRPLFGRVLLAAFLALWAGTAAGQEMTITHTGSASVIDGKIQLVEGGDSTTFQIDLEEGFVEKLKAAYPDEMTRTGAQIAGGLFFYRDSSSVEWSTTSSTTFQDRTDEFEVSHNGNALRHRYNARSFSSSVPLFREARIWFYVPLGSENDGESSSATSDLAAFEDSFPITFTIKAEGDDILLEEDESIRVTFAVIADGSSAFPTFSLFQVGSQTLSFDLVEGPLPEPTGKPTMPANLAATAGKGAVGLAWDPIDRAASNTNQLNDLNITKHQYRQAVDGDITDEAWVDIQNSGYGGVNAAGYTIAGLTDGTDYTFQVRAVNGCAESDPATAVTATPQAGALATPMGLTATAGNTQITLAWAAPTGADAATYEYQSKEGAACWSQP